MHPSLKKTINDNFHPLRVFNYYRNDLLVAKVFEDRLNPAIIYGKPMPYKLFFRLPLQNSGENDIQNFGGLYEAEAEMAKLYDAFKAKANVQDREL